MARTWGVHSGAVQCGQTALKSVPMNASTDLPQLRVICLRLLAEYVFEADRALKLLASIEKFPMTSNGRQVLMEQQRKENEAYQNYQSARRKLIRED